MEKIVWIYNSPGKDEKAHMNALNKFLFEKSIKDAEYGRNRYGCAVS